MTDDTVFEDTSPAPDGKRIEGKAAVVAFWREWFGIVHGEVEVVLEDVRTKERETLILDASKDGYVRLETGPYVAHAFRSHTPSAALLNYANSKWNNSDTFPYPLLDKP